MAASEKLLLPNLHQFETYHLQYKAADNRFVESFVVQKQHLAKLQEEGKYLGVIERQQELCEAMKQFYDVVEVYIEDLRWNLAIAKGMRTMDNQQQLDFIKKTNTIMAEVKAMMQSNSVNLSIQKGGANATG